jgi:hypothetical protein
VAMSDSDDIATHTAVWEQTLNVLPERLTDARLVIQSMLEAEVDRADILANLVGGLIAAVARLEDRVLKLEDR